jgi:hypothetical protein
VGQAQVESRQLSARGGQVADTKRLDTRLRASFSARRDGSISAVAWSPEEELDHPSWVAVGYRLGAISRCNQWWVGDWLRYGARRWGEKYTEAARITGYDPATLRNIAWVTSRFDVSLRNDSLTWSHHVLLASLPERTKRRYWLERSKAERLSVSDLRIELRASQQHQSSSREPRVKATSERRVATRSLACPNCGHRLSVPVDFPPVGDSAHSLPPTGPMRRMTRT